MKVTPDNLYSNGEMVCYVVRLRDAYCSYGIIGLIGVTGDVLELFCLSCRAFGRGISQRMIDYILENKLAEKCHIFDTGRNSEMSRRLSESFEVLA